ncbi:MAG: hypothetical protein WBA53_07020 [Burkholderiaceae bacterium]
MHGKPKGEGQPQPADPDASKAPGQPLSGQGGLERNQQITGTPNTTPAKK